MPIPRHTMLLMGALSFSAWAAPQPESAPVVTSGAAAGVPVDKSISTQKPTTSNGGGIVKGPGKVTAPKPRVVSMLMAEGLRFDPPRFEAKPGELIQIQVENIDPSHLSHNFVVVQPGQVQEVVQLAMALGEGGPATGFVPRHPAIIASSSKVVDPEKKAGITFKVPMEEGIYGYVCTVPGHGMIMYGALYVGVPMPPLGKDTNIPQVNMDKGLAGGGRRPFVQRMFLPNAGPAAIAVALPENQNYCFDAGSGSVRYVWTGPFLDAAPYWRGNGNAIAELGDTPWWTGEISPIRFGDNKSGTEKTKFLGYELIDGNPEFHLKVGKQDVFERVTPFGNGVEIHFRLPGNGQKLTLLGGKGAFVASSTAGDFVKGILEVAAEKSAEFSVRLESTAESTHKVENSPDHAHPKTSNP